MAKQNHPKPLAVSYAQSLLELANEQGSADAIGHELHDVRQIIDDNPAFAEFLRDPAVGHVERSAMLEKVFAGRVSPLVWNFLRVVNAKGRNTLLLTIDQAYADLLDEQIGKVEVDVTVAQRLSDEQLEDVRRRVGESLGKNVIVHQYVDESIIGGVVLRIEDRVIDASVRQQLQSLRRQLFSGARRRPAAPAA